MNKNEILIIKGYIMVMVTVMSARYVRTEKLFTKVSLEDTSVKDFQSWRDCSRNSLKDIKNLEKNLKDKHFDLN